MWLDVEQEISVGGEGPVLAAHQQFQFVGDGTHQIHGGNDDVMLEPGVQIMIHRWLMGSNRRPQRIVTHAATRDAAELIGRNLTEHGYRVECALLQSVGLDTRAWTETERSVAFLLSGVLPDRAP